MFLDELSPERRDEMIDGLSKRVHDWGMITPAILVADTFRPFSFILSQVVHFMAPIGDIVTGHPYMSEAGFLLQDRENIDRLLERLESLAKEDRTGDDGPDDDDDEDDEDNPGS